MKNRQRICHFICLVAVLSTAPAYHLAALQSSGFLEGDPSVNEIFREADEISSVRSLLIQKHGKLIAEEYFDGQTPGRPINIKSACKSIMSLLVGIAIDYEFIPGKDQPIHPYFPEYFEQITDSLKRTITIEDLLTMRSGLETTSFESYGKWVVSNDWVEYVLEQPMVDQPGNEMLYSSGSSHLLSIIIEKSTGMSTRRFAEKHLFEPLEIEPGEWQQDPDGYYFGGNNLHLKPADMVKIGQMVLNGGIYNNQRIVSEEWLLASMRTYTRSKFNSYDYGYMWWNRVVGGYKIFFAWGFGGQYIFIIPELDSIVVITSSRENADQSRSYQEPIYDLLRTHVFPALEND